MSQRRITKVKLTKDQKVHISYEESSGVEEIAPDKVIREGEHKAHPDLLAAFQAFRPHIGVIAEYGLMTEFEDNPEQMEPFKVTGITISGEDEKVGFVLTAQRVLKDGRILNINTPFMKMDPADSDYAYAESLNEDINALLVEADEYLNGKYAPSPQLDLFDSGADDDNEEFSEEDEEELEGEIAHTKTRKLKVSA